MQFLISIPLSVFCRKKKGLEKKRSVLRDTLFLHVNNYILMLQIWTNILYFEEKFFFVSFKISPKGTKATAKHRKKLEWNNYLVMASHL